MDANEAAQAIAHENRIGTMEVFGPQHRFLCFALAQQTPPQHAVEQPGFARGREQDAVFFHKQVAAGAFGQFVPLVDKECVEVPGLDNPGELPVVEGAGGGPRRRDARSGE